MAEELRITGDVVLNSNIDEVNKQLEQLRTNLTKTGRSLEEITSDLVQIGNISVALSKQNWTDQVSMIRHSISDAYRQEKGLKKKKLSPEDQLEITKRAQAQVTASGVDNGDKLARSLNLALNGLIEMVRNPEIAGRYGNISKQQEKLLGTVTPQIKASRIQKNLDKLIENYLETKISAYEAGIFSSGKITPAQQEALFDTRKLARGYKDNTESKWRKETVAMLEGYTDSKGKPIVSDLIADLEKSYKSQAQEMASFLTAPVTAQEVTQALEQLGKQEELQAREITELINKRAATQQVTADLAKIWGLKGKIASSFSRSLANAIERENKQIAITNEAKGQQQLLKRQTREQAETQKQATLSRRRMMLGKGLEALSAERKSRQNLRKKYGSLAPEIQEEIKSIRGNMGKNEGTLEEQVKSVVQDLLTITNLKSGKDLSDYSGLIETILYNAIMSYREIPLDQKQKNGIDIKANWRIPRIESIAQEIMQKRYMDTQTQYMEKYIENLVNKLNLTQDKGYLDLLSGDNTSYEKKLEYISKAMGISLDEMYKNIAQRYFGRVMKNTPTLEELPVSGKEVADIFDMFPNFSSGQFVLGKDSLGRRKKIFDEFSLTPDDVADIINLRGIIEQVKNKLGEDLYPVINRMLGPMDDPARIIKNSGITASNYRPNPSSFQQSTEASERIKEERRQASLSPVDLTLEKIRTQKTEEKRLKETKIQQEQQKRQRTLISRQEGKLEQKIPDLDYVEYVRRERNDIENQEEYATWPLLYGSLVDKMGEELSQVKDYAEWLQTQSQKRNGKGTRTLTPEQQEQEAKELLNYRNIRKYLESSVENFTTQIDFENKGLPIPNYSLSSLFNVKDSTKDNLRTIPSKIFNGFEEKKIPVDKDWLYTQVRALVNDLGLRKLVAGKTLYPEHREEVDRILKTSYYPSIAESVAEIVEEALNHQSAIRRKYNKGKVGEFTEEDKTALLKRIQSQLIKQKDKIQEKADTAYKTKLDSSSTGAEIKLIKALQDMGVRPFKTQEGYLNFTAKSLAGIKYKWFAKDGRSGIATTDENTEYSFYTLGQLMSYLEGSSEEIALSQEKINKFWERLGAIAKKHDIRTQAIPGKNKELTYDMPEPGSKYAPLPDLLEEWINRSGSTLLHERNADDSLSVSIPQKYISGKGIGSEFLVQFKNSLLGYGDSRYKSKENNTIIPTGLLETKFGFKPNETEYYRELLRPVSDAISTAYNVENKEILNFLQVVDSIFGRTDSPDALMREIKADFDEAAGKKIALGEKQKENALNQTKAYMGTYEEDYLTGLGFGDELEQKVSELEKRAKRTPETIRDWAKGQAQGVNPITRIMGKNPIDSSGANVILRNIVRFLGQGGNYARLEEEILGKKLQVYSTDLEMQLDFYERLNGLKAISSSIADNGLAGYYFDTGGVIDENGKEVDRNFTFDELLEIIGDMAKQISISLAPKEQGGEGIQANITSKQKSQLYQNLIALENLSRYLKAVKVKYDDGTLAEEEWNAVQQLLANFTAETKSQYEDPGSGKHKMGDRGFINTLRTEGIPIPGMRFSKNVFGIPRSATGDLNFSKPRVESALNDDGTPKSHEELIQKTLEENEDRVRSLMERISKINGQKDIPELKELDKSLEYINQVIEYRNRLIEEKTQLLKQNKEKLTAEEKTDLQREIELLNFQLENTITNLRNSGIAYSYDQDRFMPIQQMSDTERATSYKDMATEVDSITDIKQLNALVDSFFGGWKQVENLGTLQREESTKKQKIHLIDLFAEELVRQSINYIKPLGFEGTEVWDYKFTENEIESDLAAIFPKVVNNLLESGKVERIISNNPQHNNGGLFRDFILTQFGNFDEATGKNFILEPDTLMRLNGETFDALTLKEVVESIKDILYYGLNYKEINTETLEDYLKNFRTLGESKDKNKRAVLESLFELSMKLRKRQQELLQQEEQKKIDATQQTEEAKRQLEEMTKKIPQLIESFNNNFRKSSFIDGSSTVAKDYFDSRVMVRGVPSNFMETYEEKLKEQAESKKVTNLPRLNTPYLDWEKRGRSRTRSSKDETKGKQTNEKQVEQEQKLMEEAVTQATEKVVDEIVSNVEKIEEDTRPVVKKLPQVETSKIDEIATKASKEITRRRTKSKKQQTKPQIPQQTREATQQTEEAKRQLESAYSSDFFIPNLEKKYTFSGPSYFGPGIKFGDEFKFIIDIQQKLLESMVKPQTEETYMAQQEIYKKLAEVFTQLPEQLKDWFVAEFLRSKNWNFEGIDLNSKITEMLSELADAIHIFYSEYDYSLIESLNRIIENGFNFSTFAKNINAIPDYQELIKTHSSFKPDGLIISDYLKNLLLPAWEDLYYNGEVTDRNPYGLPGNIEIEKLIGKSGKDNTTFESEQKISEEVQDVIETTEKVIEETDRRDEHLKEQEVDLSKIRQALEEKYEKIKAGEINNKNNFIKTIPIIEDSDKNISVKNIAVSDDIIPMHYNNNYKDSLKNVDRTTNKITDTSSDSVRRNTEEINKNIEAKKTKEKQTERLTDSITNEESALNREETVIKNHSSEMGIAAEAEKEKSKISSELAINLGQEASNLEKINNILQGHASQWRDAAEVEHNKAVEAREVAKELGAEYSAINTLSQPIQHHTDLINQLAEAYEKLNAQLPPNYGGTPPTPPVPPNGNPPTPPGGAPPNNNNNNNNNNNCAKIQIAPLDFVFNDKEHKYYVKNPDGSLGEEIASLTRIRSNLIGQELGAGISDLVERIRVQSIIPNLGTKIKSSDLGTDQQSYDSAMRLVTSGWYGDLFHSSLDKIIKAGRADTFTTLDDLEKIDFGLWSNIMTDKVNAKAMFENFDGLDSSKLEILGADLQAYFDAYQKLKKIDSSLTITQFSEKPLAAVLKGPKGEFKFAGTPDQFVLGSKGGFFMDNKTGGVHGYEAFQLTGQQILSMANSPMLKQAYQFKDAYGNLVDPRFEDIDFSYIADIKNGTATLIKNLNLGVEEFYNLVARAQGISNDPLRYRKLTPDEQTKFLNRQLKTDRIVGLSDEAISHGETVESVLNKAYKFQDKETIIRDYVSAFKAFDMAKTAEKRGGYILSNLDRTDPRYSIFEKRQKIFEDEADAKEIQWRKFFARPSRDANGELVGGTIAGIKFNKQEYEGVIRQLQEVHKEQQLINLSNQAKFESSYYGAMKKDLEEIIRLYKEYKKAQEEVRVLEREISKMPNGATRDAKQRELDAKRDIYNRLETEYNTKFPQKVGIYKNGLITMQRLINGRDFYDTPLEKDFDEKIENIDAQTRVTQAINDANWIQKQERLASTISPEQLSAIKEYMSYLKRINELENLMRKNEIKKQSTSNVYDRRNLETANEQFRAQMLALKDEAPVYDRQQGTITTKDGNVINLNAAGQAKIEKDITAEKHRQEKINTKIQSQTKQQSGLLSKIFEGFKRSFRSLIDYQLAYRIIGKIRQAISTLINDAKQLNTSMVNLQIASGQDYKGIYNLTKTFADLGQEMGRTTQDLTSAANDWLRAGFSVKQATDLTKASMELSTLGMVEASDATKYLISVLKGWKLEVGDVEDVVSKLVSVDMNAAISAGDLAEAMSRSNNSAQLAGLSMDKYIGLLTVGADITQRAPETIGTAWNTLFARLNNVKAGKFAASQEVQNSEDYNSEEWESLNDVETVLNSIGIKLRDTFDSFRSTEDVLDEIAKKWETFNDVTKNAVATAVAGTRQREIFFTTMENYESVSKYARIASESQGATAKKMEVFTDSLQASQNRIANSWEQLTLDLNLQGALKKFYDVVNYIINNLGKLSIAIGAVAVGGNLPTVSKTLIRGVNLFSNFAVRTAGKVSNLKNGPTLLGGRSGIQGIKDTFTQDYVEMVNQQYVAAMQRKIQNLTLQEQQDIQAIQNSLILNNATANEIHMKFLNGQMDEAQYIQAIENLQSSDQLSIEEKREANATRDLILSKKNLSASYKELIAKNNLERQQALKSQTSGYILPSIGMLGGAYIGGTIGEIFAGDSGKIFGSLIGSMGLSALAKPVYESFVDGIKMFSTSAGDALTKMVPGFVGLMISGATIAYSVLKKKSDAQVKEIQEKYKETQTSYNNKINASIDVEEYDKLVQGVDSLGRNLSLTEDEYKRFIELSNNLSDIFPELVVRTDSLGNSFVGVGQKVGEMGDTIKQNLLETQRVLAKTLFSTQHTFIFGDRGQVTEDLKRLSDSYKHYISKKADAEIYLSPDEYKELYNTYGKDNLIEGNFYWLESRGERLPYAREEAIKGHRENANREFEASAEDYKDSQENMQAYVDSVIYLDKRLYDKYNNLNDNEKAVYDIFTNAIPFSPELIGLEDDSILFEKTLKRKIEQVLDNLINDSEIQKAFDDFYSLDFSKIKIDEYLPMMDTIKENIIKSTKGWSDEERNKIFEDLGFIITNDEIIETYNPLDSIEKDYGILETYADKNQLSLSNLAYLTLEDIGKVETYLKQGIISVDASMNEIVDLLTMDREIPDDMSQIDKYILKTTTAYETFENTINALSIETPDVIEDFFNSGKYKALFSQLPEQYRNMLEEINKEIKKGGVESIDWDEKINLAKLQEAREVATIAVKQATEAIDISFGSGLKEDVDGIIDTFADLKTALEYVANTFETLSDAFKEQSQNGKLALSTIVDLLAADEKYINVLEIVDGKIRLKTNATETMLDFQKKATLASINAMKVEKQLEIQEIKNKLTYIQSGNAISNENVAKDDAIGATYALNEQVNDLTKSCFGLVKVMEALFNADKNSEPIDLTSIYLNAVNSADSVIKDAERHTWQQNYDALTAAEQAAMEKELNETLAIKEKEEEILQALYEQVEGVNKENIKTELKGYMNDDSDSSSDTDEQTDPLERLKSLQELINKEYEAMEVFDKITNASMKIEVDSSELEEAVATADKLNESIEKGTKKLVKKDTEYYKKMYDNLIQQQDVIAQQLIDKQKKAEALRAKANKYSTSDISEEAIEARDEAWEAEEEVIKLQQEQIENTVKIRNLDDEQLEDELKLAEAKGYSLKAQMAIVQEQIKAADTEEELVELQNKMNDLVKEEYEERKRIRDFQNDRLTSISEDLYSGTALSNRQDYDKIQRLRLQVLGNNVAEIKSAADMAYQKAVYALMDQGMSLEDAQKEAMFDEEVTEKQTEYLEAVKERGEILYNAYQDKFNEIQRQIDLIDKGKPQEWSSIDQIKTNTQQNITALQQQAQVLKETLKDTEFLTDEQIEDLVDQLNDITVALHEAQIQMTQDIIDYQDKQFDAIISKVEEYKDALQDQIDKIEDAYEEEIAPIKAANEERDRALAIEEKLAAIKEKQEQKERIYREGELKF